MKLILKLIYKKEKLKTRFVSLVFISKKRFFGRLFNKIENKSIINTLSRFRFNSRWQASRKPRPTKINLYLSRNFQKSAYANFFSKDKHFDTIQPETVYPTSNDKFNLNLIPPVKTPDQIFVGIGNLDSLNILSRLNPKLILFIDINHSQLSYLDYIINLLTQTQTRAEFIGTFFSKTPSQIRDKILNNLSSADKGSLENSFWNLPFWQIKTNEPWGKLMQSYKIKRDSKGNPFGIIFKKIGGDVFGKIEIVSTLVLDNPDLFPLIKPDGFLWTEENFQNLKKLFKTTPIVMLNKSLASCFKSIADNFQYKTQIYWLSNLFGTWEFFSKEIKLLSKSISETIYNVHSGYNAIFIEDSRNPFFPKINTLPSTHWETLNVVSRFLSFPCLEVVSHLKWAKMKYSKIPFTQYIFLDDFIDLKQGSFKSIFLHTLLENCDLEKFKMALQKAFTFSKTLIILEHDFVGENPNQKNNFNLKEIVSNFGKLTNFFEIKRNSGGKNYIFVLKS